MRIGVAFDLKSAVTGPSAVEDALEEYDSPETVDAIERTLAARGDTVIRLGGGNAFLDAVRGQPVDIVFNIAEGRGTYRSREAQVPSVLEMLGIPCTGSDPLCLAVSLDKPVAKTLVKAAGVRTPACLVIDDYDKLEEATWERLSFPVVVKPVFEGSSKGVRLTSIARDKNEAVREAGRIIADYRQGALIEEFIDGDEVTVGLIGNPPRVAGIMRIVPKVATGYFVYSLEVKRDYERLVEYEAPARLPCRVLDELAKASQDSFRVLGCRDFARADFRVARDGTPYFIEINPLPGLGSYSDLIIMAGLLGRSQADVINAVFEAALERYAL